MSRDGDDPDGREVRADAPRATTETHTELPADGSLRGPAPEERPNPSGKRTADGVRLEQAAGTDSSAERRVLSAIVNHDPGVLMEVAGLFSRRMFNIESLTVGPTADDDYARATIVIEESGSGVEQARKQLASLASVHIVSELDTDAVERELVLLKIDCDDPEQVRAVAEMQEATVVDVSASSATVQLTGTERAVDDAIQSFGRFTIREISRTGTTALDRSATTVYDDADHGQTPTDFAPDLTDGHAKSDERDESTTDTPQTQIHD